MIRHQRVALAAIAGIGTALAIPVSPVTLLLAIIPALWGSAYVAHRADIISSQLAAVTRRIDSAEANLADRIDIGVADTIVAFDRGLNQRERAYRRPPELRSVT